MLLSSSTVGSLQSQWPATYGYSLQGVNRIINIGNLGNDLIA